MELFFRLIELHGMKRKVPSETILLMGVKVLNVAKSNIREKNTRLGGWQQNCEVESSLGKLNFFLPPRILKFV